MYRDVYLNLGPVVLRGPLLPALLRPGEVDDGKDEETMKGDVY